MGVSSICARLALALALVTGCAGEGSESDECNVSGTACVWAGTGEAGYNIENETAHRLKSLLYFPMDVTFDAEGRGYIVDWNNHRIRRVEKDNSLVVVIGTDYEGDGPPQMEDRLPLCNPAGADALTVALNHMTDVEFGPDGLLYMAAWHNNKIRSFDPATGVMISVAGDSYGYAGDGGPACRAVFNQPKAIAFGGDGTMYTVDQRNVLIRAIKPDGNIATIAGTWRSVGSIGDNGPADQAMFGFETGTTPRPSGSLVVDGRTLYIADSLNNRIRRINLDTGMIDCIAGLLEPGYSGDGGDPLQAKLDFPMDIELGPDGRLYVADRNNDVIRAIDFATNTIETVAGTGVRCDVDTESCADRVPARELGLYEPYGVTFDPAGHMYISDTHNHRVIRVAR